MSECDYEVTIYFSHGNFIIRCNESGVKSVKKAFKRKERNHIFSCEDQKDREELVDFSHVHLISIRYVD